MKRAVIAKLTFNLSNILIIKPAISVLHKDIKITLSIPKLLASHTIKK